MKRHLIPAVLLMLTALPASALPQPPGVRSLPQSTLEAARARSLTAPSPAPGWENTAMMEAPAGSRIDEGHRAETENDACQYARGSTIVVHIFINSTDKSWTDEERDDSAAKGVVAKDFYLDHAPTAANLHFDHEGENEYYYYNTYVSYALGYDGLTRAVMEDALIPLGATDDDGDGWMFDDFSAALQKSYGGWDNVVCLFEPAHVYGRCWAEINGFSWCAIYFGEDAHVMAHEWGHIFGACDEYVEDGHCAHGADCGPCASFFLDEEIENGNCQLAECPSDVSCVMDNNIFAYCQYTQNYWAWVDEDGDGTLDWVKRHIPPDTVVRIDEIPHDHYVYSSNTVDGYVIAQKTNTWCAIGLRSPAGSDYDLLLYGENNHQYLLTSSSMDSPAVDFVVADYNHNQLQNDYVQIARFAGPENSYRLHWESGAAMLFPDGVVRSGTWSASNVVRTWDVPLFSGETITFTLDITSGTPDLGMGLFKSNGSVYYAPRSSGQWLCDAGGAGVTETYTYTVPATDVYGLVVWSNSYASGDFTIQIGPAPLTLSEETPSYSSYPLRLYTYNPNAFSWSFVGVRPDDGSNMTLRLCDESTYETELAVSDDYSGIEFVAADYNAGHTQDYVRVTRLSGTDNHRTEWEQDDDILAGTASVSWSPTHVGKVWDVQMDQDQAYFFREYHAGSDLDTGFYLYSSAGGNLYKPRSAWSAYSNNHPAGDGGEWFGYTAPATDWYGLCMIMNNEASGSMSLWFGPKFLMGSDSRKTTSSEVVWGQAGVTRDDWAAFGVRPETGDQASVWLYGDDAYTVSTLYASDQNGSGVNFVVADFNHCPTGTYYPRFRRTDGTGEIDCEWEGGPGGFIFSSGEINSYNANWMAGDVVDAWDLYVDGSIEGGQDVTIQVDDLSGVMDLGVAVFTSNGAAYYGNPSDATVIADNNGVGESETVSFVATREDWYGLIFFNQTDGGGLYKITFMDQPPTSVGVSPAAHGLALGRVSPNPFVTEATLQLSLPQAGHVDLGIYDISGRRLRTLASARLSAGTHALVWDGRDDRGNPAPSGVYFARLQACGEERKAKLIRCGVK